MLSCCRSNNAVVATSKTIRNDPPEERSLITESNEKEEKERVERPDDSSSSSSSSSESAARLDDRPSGHVVVDDDDDPGTTFRRPLTLRPTSSDDVSTVFEELPSEAHVVVVDDDVRGGGDKEPPLPYGAPVWFSFAERPDRAVSGFVLGYSFGSGGRRVTGYRVGVAPTERPTADALERMRDVPVERVAERWVERARDETTAANENRATRSSAPSSSPPPKGATLKRLRAVTNDRRYRPGSTVREVVRDVFAPDAKKKGACFADETLNGRDETVVVVSHSWNVSYERLLDVLEKESDGGGENCIFWARFASTPPPPKRRRTRSSLKTTTTTTDPDDDPLLAGLRGALERADLVLAVETIDDDDPSNASASSSAASLWPFHEVFLATESNVPVRFVGDDSLSDRRRNDAPRHSYDDRGADEDEDGRRERDVLSRDVARRGGVDRAEDAVAEARARSRIADWKRTAAKEEADEAEPALVGGVRTVSADAARVNADAARAAKASAVRRIDRRTRSERTALPLERGDALRTNGTTKRNGVVAAYSFVDWMDGLCGGGLACTAEEGDDEGNDDDRSKVMM